MKKAKQTIAIIGGGASALMFATQINTSDYDVFLFEKNQTLGRKFLVAGDGGLNITHSEDKTTFIKNYLPSSFIQKYFNEFNNQNLIEWLNKNGVETFIGSSKRVFPKKGIKPIEVLNMFLNKIKSNKVVIKSNHKWIGWQSANELLFEHNENSISLKFDYIIFALGGASWKVTGSDGSYLPLFENAGIKTIPFQSSNCGFEVKWPKDFIEKNEGAYLKNIAVSCGAGSKKGELIISELGIEGGAVYALSNKIRYQLNHEGKAKIFIDLKTQISLSEIEKKLISFNGSISEALKSNLNLSTTAIQLLKTHLSKEQFLDPSLLAKSIKNFKLDIVGLAPMNEAISTVGGIALEEIDENLALKKLKNTFCMGEMLDWDAPTGGYLLQANFSMGYFLANHFNTKIQ